MPIVLRKNTSNVVVGGGSSRNLHLGAPSGSAIWGNIFGDINNQADLLALIQSAIQPSSPREVLNCFEVDYFVSDVEDVENPQTGKTYFEWDSENIKVYNGTSFQTIASIRTTIGNGFIVSENAVGSQLYVFVDVGSGILPEPVTPDDTLIYAVDKYNTDGTYDSKIYLYNQSSHEFVDVTGESGGYVDDNTIYVNDIDTELDDYTDTAIYTAYVTKKVMFGAGTQIYTFIVTRGSKVVYPTRLRVTYYNQVLMNNDGYLFRTKTQGGSWGEWQKNIYATEEMVKKAIKLAKAAL